jgi:hypothetical protein
LGPNDTLQILSPTGEKITELSSPSLGKVVSVPPATAQMSFGRDAMDRLTLIVGSNPKNPQSLSFSVLGRTVELTRDTVISLSFSNDLKTVSLDPGFIGVVKVDGREVSQMVVLQSPNGSMPEPVAVSSKPSAAPMTPPPAAEIPASVVTSNPVPPSAPAPQASAPVVSDAAPITPSSRKNSDVTPMKTAESQPVPTPAYSPTANVDLRPISTTAPDVTSAPMQASILNPTPVPVAAVPPRLWNEPVTAPGQTSLPVLPGEMKLMEVRGDVQVSFSGNPMDFRNATEGMIVPNGVLIKTDGGSTAAVVMGGVDSARLAPGTEAVINSEVDRNVRNSNVDVKKGTIFARVGRRLGETQDFKVHSIYGVAAARGTSYAVKVDSTRMIIFGNDGKVQVDEVGGRKYVLLAPTAGGPPQVACLPRGTPTTDEDIDALNAVIRALNAKTNQILSKNPSTLTDAEKAYLQVVGATPDNSGGSRGGPPTGGRNLTPLKEWMENPPLPNGQHSRDPANDRDLKPGKTTPF